MVTGLRPGRGGFLRPFGVAWFIAELLKGNRPFGSAAVNPAVGLPQADIHAAYKSALHQAFAEDAAALDADEAIRAGKPITQEETENRKEYYLARIPYKLTRMRYHSFIDYFGMLKRLGWVERSGKEEDSSTQEAMSLKPDEKTREEGQPRIYYRLTAKGKRATLGELSNPLRLLYPHFDSEYFRKAKKEKLYVRH